MLNRRGQSTLEYAIIIAVVVGGLLVMQHYVKRGYQGKLKESSDQMGEQFDPNAFSADYTISQSSAVEQTVKNTVSKTTHTADQTNTKTGSETLEKWNKERDVFTQ